MEFDDVESRRTTISGCSVVPVIRVVVDVEISTRVDQIKRVSYRKVVDFVNDVALLAILVLILLCPDIKVRESTIPE